MQLTLIYTNLRLLFYVDNYIPVMQAQNMWNLEGCQFYLLGVKNWCSDLARKMCQYLKNFSWKRQTICCLSANVHLKHFLSYIIEDYS